MTEDMREIDLKEKKAIEEFMINGCGCAKECSSFFEESYLIKMRSDCSEMTHQELDALIMGQLLAVVNCSSETSSSRHTKHTRIKKSCQFMLGGNKVINQQ